MWCYLVGVWVVMILGVNRCGVWVVEGFGSRCSWFNFVGVVGWWVYRFVGFGLLGVYAFVWVWCDICGVFYLW